MDDIDLSGFLEQIKGLFKGNLSGIFNKKNTVDSTFSGFKLPIHGQFYNSGGYDADGHGKVGRKHLGVDFRAPGGTAIYPIAPGKVMSVGSDPIGGNIVLIQHKNGMYSYYAHMGTISVHEKDNVGYNTVLGTVGGTGNANGFPHLHLQISKNRSINEGPINPETLLSIPAYTNFGKDEKLWLSDDAKETANNFNINKHKQSKNRIASIRINKLCKFADKYYNLSIKF